MIKVDAIIIIIIVVVIIIDLYSHKVVTSEALYTVVV